MEHEADFPQPPRSLKPTFFRWSVEFCALKYLLGVVSFGRGLPIGFDRIYGCLY